MEDNNISITLAKSAESEMIIKILKDAAAWLHSINVDQWGYLRNGGEDDEICEGINNENTYLARMNSKIVGTFTLYEKQGEWDKYIWGNVPDNALYLHRIATIREEKYRGLGTELIKWIERECKVLEKKFIRLDCVAFNERLNNYYLSAGFKQIGINHDHCRYEKKFL